MNKKINVAYFTNIISPYRIPFLNYLNQNDDLNLNIYYLAEIENDRNWNIYKNEINYNYKVVNGLHIYFRKRTIHFNYNIMKELNVFHPDIIIIGTDILASPISWFLLKYSRSKKIKTIRFEAQHTYGKSISYFKKFLYKKYYSYIDSFFVYSQLTYKYLFINDVNPAKIIVGYNVGDTEYFYQKVNEYRNSNNFITERNKYPGVIFIFSGNLDKRKNIINLLQIFLKLNLPDSCLLILGDGPLMNKAKEISSKFKNMKIFFMGFVQKDQSIKYYAIADIFILPTLYDPASIVLSEALQSGLFTIGSYNDGSSHNFINDGINGYIIDPHDQAMLAQKIHSAYMMKNNNLIDRNFIKNTMANYTTYKYSQRLYNLIKSLI